MRLSKGALLLALGLGLVAGKGARAESFFSFYSGFSDTHASDIHIVEPTVGTNAVYHGAHWDGKEFESPPYYALKFGKFSRDQPRWGVELDLNHYKVYSDRNQVLPLTGTWNGAPVNGNERLGNRVQNFSISHGVNTIGVHLLYRWQAAFSPSFREGRIQPFLGVGPAYYILHQENTINNRSLDQDYKPNNIGWQAVAGLKYGVEKRTSLFLQVKYSSAKAEVDTAAGGYATTWLNTWHSNLGVQYTY